MNALDLLTYAELCDALQRTEHDPTLAAPIRAELVRRLRDMRAS